MRVALQQVSVGCSRVIRRGGLVPRRGQRFASGLAARARQSLREPAVTSAGQQQQTKLPWDVKSLVYVEQDEEGPTTSGSQQQLKCCELNENLFNVNVGKAITTLREELPQVLDRDLSYEIYTEDVAYVDEISPSFGRKASTAHGKQSLRRVAFGIRFFAKVLFSRSKFDVMKVWQPESDKLCVRWTFKGLPRFIGDTTTYLDGMTTYKFNRQGLIASVVQTNLDTNTHFKVQDLQSLVTGVVGQSGSWPTPSYFQGSGSE
mmetsp:Transcript_19010/g.39712  ORF Transcript_19010/g.39712 Transcript_19010/m.39712 type:complete len:261 (-) Transcript_19010:1268-2050(-)